MEVHICQIGGRVAAQSMGDQDNLHAAVAQRAKHLRDMHRRALRAKHGNARIRAHIRQPHS
jgi:hypothetical protein